MYYNIPLSDYSPDLKPTTTIINTISFDTHLKTAVTEVKNKIKMQSKCPITFHSNLKSSPFKYENLNYRVAHVHNLN